MEVPVIHRLSDFQVLQNNPLSRITSSFSGVDSVSVAYSFYKLGAVILAIVATFSFGTIINRFKILVIGFRRHAPSLVPSVQIIDDGDYSSSDEDDDGDDDGASSTASSISSEFEDETTTSSSSSSFNFRVRGSGDGLLRRRCSIGDIFSLSEIANNKSVVKLWDSIGFGLGLDFDDGYDFPAGALAPSPAVGVSGEKNASGKTAVKIWDTRLRRGLPAVIGEWGPTLGKIVGVGFGHVDKFYVRSDGYDDVTVGDLRKVRTPLENVTKSDVAAFWDVDSVIVRW